MRKYVFLLVCTFLTSLVFAQKAEVIQLTKEQAEGLFLKQNLQLLAEKMNIDAAEAAVVQAKLWDNPNFSLGDVNLWSTKSQREQEQIPALFGKFAKNTEFTMELSQMVKTARKRGKLINREKVSKEIAVQEFEETLRGLKLEVRKSLQELIYLQSYQKILNHQQEALSKLITAYKNQVAEGNIAKKDLIRLQSSQLELSGEIYEVKNNYNEQQKIIKSLLNIPPLNTVEILEGDNEVKNPDDILLPKILEEASESRSDIKIANLQIDYFDKDLLYEKAQKVPDLTFAVNYDRISAPWKDFIGFGVSFDLPFFNRNQGNIKLAQVNKEQSKYQAKQVVTTAQHEITEAYTNYSDTYHLFKDIQKENISEDLDYMLDAYTRNLMKRNISMLEFIDFMDAYKTNKETLLNTQKNLYTQFEELQYTVGKEIR